MNEEEKKTETEVTPEGAVEIQEEDLDQASGGAAYVKMPTDQVKYGLGFDLDPSARSLGDGSVKPAGYDLKANKKI